jgi:hypothetical protein
MQHSLAHSRSRKAGPFLRRLPFAGAVLLAASTILATHNAPAQTPDAPGMSTQKPAGHSRPRHAVKSKGKTETPATVAPVPLVPPKPNWPVNDPPAPPTVTWDNHGLQIKAANSSLRQILAEVSTDTGAKVEGIDQDERIFGDYGPAPARDVLSQLLHGTAYNVLMIGDQGEGTPREIVLSPQLAGSSPQPQPQPAQAGSDEDQDNGDETPPPPNPVINRPPMAMPGNQPMTPQQRWQLMQQQRQQQMEQERQQQTQQEQQNPPVNPPPQ